MALIQTTKILAFTSFIILLAGSCTTTTTKTKNPAFNTSMDSLQITLNNLVSCENINLDGKEITTNGKISSELEIDITNGQTIPTDENQMSALAKQIATSIKGALQNKNEYDTFKVLFVVKKENGGITQRTWRGKVFKSQEL